MSRLRRNRAVSGSACVRAACRRAGAGRPVRVPAVAVGLAALLAGGAHATVLVPAGLEELARGAGAIVRGQIVAADPRWAADRHAIETVVTLRAEAWLKASLGETVQFVVPGGKVGRYRSLLVGGPEFRPGERAIVFLRWHGPALPSLVGLGQGVYRIDAAGNVTPPLLAAPASPALLLRGDPSRRPIPLVDFERRVRALVERAR